MNGKLAIHTARSMENLLGRTVIKTLSFGLKIGQWLTTPYPKRNHLPQGTYYEVCNASEWFWKNSSRAEKSSCAIYNEHDIIENLRVSYYFPTRVDTLQHPEASGWTFAPHR